MIRAMTMLLVCQLAGEAIVRALAIALPGPVLGMLILFAGLWLRRTPPDDLKVTATGILKNLSLLFVPAAVGIIQHLDRIRAEWLAISVALVGSTLLAMIAAALTFQGIKRLMGAPDEDKAAGSPPS